MLTSPGQQAQPVPQEIILDSDDSIVEGAPGQPGAQHEGPAGRRLATNRRGRSRVPAPAGATHVDTDMGSTPLAVPIPSHTASGQATSPLRSAGPAGAAHTAFSQDASTLHSAGSTGAAQSAPRAPTHPGTSHDLSSSPTSFAGGLTGYRRETSQNEPARTKRSASDSRRDTSRPDPLDDSVEQDAPKVRVRRSSPIHDRPGSSSALVSMVGIDTLFQTIAHPTGTPQDQAAQAYRPYTGGFTIVVPGVLRDSTPPRPTEAFRGARSLTSLRRVFPPSRLHRCPLQRQRRPHRPVNRSCQ